MRREINDDNLYKEGTVISAKVEPNLKLVIMKYRQRIYYCSVVGHPDQNGYAYFERELVPPNEEDQRIQFSRVHNTNSLEKNYVMSK